MRIAAHGNTPRGLDPADTKSAGVLHLASELRGAVRQEVVRYLGNPLAHLIAIERHGLADDVGVELLALE